MALVLNTKPVELHDPTLGRLLAKRWNLGAMMEAEACRVHSDDPDGFVAKLLSVIARSVPPDVPIEDQSHEAGCPIEEAKFAKLSPDALDALSEAYLAEMASWMTPPSDTERGDPPHELPLTETAVTDMEPNDNERPSERLRRLASASLTSLRESSAKLVKSVGAISFDEDLYRALTARTAAMEALSSTLGDHGISDALRSIVDPIPSLGGLFDRIAPLHHDPFLGTFGHLDAWRNQLEDIDKPYRDALRDIEESSAFVRMRQVLAQNDEAMRAALGPLHDLENSGVLGPNSLFSRAMQEVDEVTRQYEATFRLPLFDEMDRLKSAFDEVTESLALAGYRRPFDAFQEAVDAIHAPWISTRDAIGSFRAFGELSALGNALDQAPPFDEAFTQALRQDLGDWTDVTHIPDRLVVSPVQRIAFYENLGFNRRLTNFPRRAFDASLDATGVRVQKPEAELAYASEHTKDPDAPPNGNLDAYDRLFRFETRIRAFIDEVMTQAFGPTWVTQRVPGDIRQEWENKKTKAREQGEADYPLISYADFTDYVTIIVRKNNWNDVFKQVFKRKESVQESFLRLFPIRICTMHARPITDDDVLLMHVEIRRLLKAIQS